MNKHYTATALYLLSCVSVAQNWEMLHPGGGGQVQGIYFDGNQPGKMFFNSDMEGTSVSSDFGQSWNATGATQQTHLMQFVTAVEPGNSNRAYNGGLWGVEISNDGGLSWTYQEFFNPTDGVNDAIVGPVAAIAVDPRDVNNVYAGNGWHNKGTNQLRDAGNHPETGEGAIAYSTNRGAAWNVSIFESATINKNTSDIAVNPLNGHIYVACDGGLYKGVLSGSSIAWTKMSRPGGTTSVCRGVTFAPNSDIMYAVFGTSGSSFKLHATSAASVNWRDVHGSMTANANWWRPRVDPRDTGNAHHVLLGGRVSTTQGLWEVEIEWSGNTPSVQSQEQLFNQTGGTSWNYDYGWKETQAKAGHFGYTPASWDKAIWCSSDEGFYVLNDGANHLSGWQPRWTEKMPNGRYNNRGIASTWNWSVDGYKSFIAQGQADNGLITSGDNGATWKRTSPPGVNDAGAIEIVPLDPPLLIVGGVSGYGGGYPGATGNLWAIALTSSGSDITGDWTRIGGGDPGIRGMNANGGKGSRIYSIHHNSANKQQVVVATENGLYLHNAISGLVSGSNQSNWTRISGGAGNVSIRDVFIDPNNTSTLYILQQDGVWKAENFSGNVAWTKISSEVTNTGMGNAGGMFVWDNSGTTCIAIGSSSGKLLLSTDRGASFHSVLSKSDVLSLRPSAKEPWYRNSDSFGFQCVAGYNTTMFVSVSSGRRHGYGVFKGTVSGTSVQWKDWTGEGDGRMRYPRSRRAKVFTNNNVTYLNICSNGMGLWRRDVTASSATAMRSGTSIAFNATPMQKWQFTSHGIRLFQSGELILHDLSGRTVLHTHLYHTPTNVSMSGIGKGVYAAQLNTQRFTINWR